MTDDIINLEEARALKRANLTRDQRFPYEYYIWDEAEFIRYQWYRVCSCCDALTGAISEIAEARHDER